MAHSNAQTIKRTCFELQAGDEVVGVGKLLRVTHYSTYVACHLANGDRVEFDGLVDCYV